MIIYISLNNEHSDQFRDVGPSELPPGTFSFFSPGVVRAGYEGGRGGVPGPTGYSARLANPAPRRGISFATCLAAGPIIRRPYALVRAESTPVASEPMLLPSAR